MKANAANILDEILEILGRGKRAPAEPTITVKRDGVLLGISVEGEPWGWYLTRPDGRVRILKSTNKGPVTCKSIYADMREARERVSFLVGMEARKK